MHFQINYAVDYLSLEPNKMVLQEPNDNNHHPRKNDENCGYDGFDVSYDFDDLQYILAFQYLKEQK